MNRISKNLVTAVFAVIVIVGCAYAGRVEHNDIIISSISNELYQKVLYDLGGSASEHEICDKYQENKEEYDALGI